ncbi:MAG TPA: hypothetical protein VFD40_00160 [Candidatus Paceibacterota bacterium]|nr:hypothetical protein [Candidatus Paceibacterota bacterium]
MKLAKGKNNEGTICFEEITLFIGLKTKSAFFKAAFFKDIGTESNTMAITFLWPKGISTTDPFIKFDLKKYEKVCG